MTAGFDMADPRGESPWRGRHPDAACFRRKFRRRNDCGRRLPGGYKLGVMHGQAQYNSYFPLPGGAPRWFAGVDSDVRTDLSDFPFREYSSIEGRWLSPDPGVPSAQRRALGWEPAGLVLNGVCAACGGANSRAQGISAGNSAKQMPAYAYVANQPLNATDPLGLTRLGPAPLNLTCLTCPDQSFWYGSGPNLPPDLQIPCYGPSVGADSNADPGDIEDCNSLATTGSYLGGGPGTGGGGAGRIGAPPSPQTKTSTCTASNGRTTAPGPGQATGPGAFGLYPATHPGMLAVDPWALGLLPGPGTNALLARYASRIAFSFSPMPHLPPGFPTSFTLGDVVGPASVRVGGSNFNGLYDFDIYGLPSLSAAYAATSPQGMPVDVAVTFPSSLPINCGGPISDPLPAGPRIALGRRKNGALTGYRDVRYRPGQLPLGQQASRSGPPPPSQPDRGSR